MGQTRRKVKALQSRAAASAAAQKGLAKQSWSINESYRGEDKHEM